MVVEIHKISEVYHAAGDTHEFRWYPMLVDKYYQEYVWVSL
jgi:hypothetical protein